MATATAAKLTAGQVTGFGCAPVEGSTAWAPNPRRDYRCECGHVLHVVGNGRHRVYFELTDTRLDDPVMNHACPQCGRAMP
jgi:hypothetical protein